MAGAWEFPGGKLNRGESATDGLRRELNEELGIVVEQAEPLLDLNYRYPDRSVRLDVWWVVSYSGRPVPCDGQQLRWVDAAALGKLPMLPADGPIVEAVLERMSSN